MRVERCPVCETPANGDALIAADEMLGGFSKFEYQRCKSCGCLWLGNPPDTISEHYPSNYGGHWVTTMPLLDRKRNLKALRARLLLRFGIRPFRTLRLPTPTWASWFGGSYLALDARICDVGCGTGYYLVELWREGFRNLSGFDAFIPGDIDYRGRVPISRRALEAITGEYDLVMLHHSLEHMVDQRRNMAVLRRIVASNGWLLVRVPLSSSWAAHAYGPHWYQLDAPRHAVLHSPVSLVRLCADFGFELSAITYDSTSDQFVGSEEYRKRAGLPPVVTQPVPAERIRELNRSGLGDQAVFLFRRTG